MAERITLRVFKGPPQTEFRQTAEAVAMQHGGAIEWNTIPGDEWRDFRVSHNDTIHTVLMPYIRDAADFLFCKKLAMALQVPWIELRIQEGCLWDYSLFLGDQHLQNFSMLPEYWDNGDEWNETQRGDSQLLARIWSIESQRIERYLVPWGFRVIEEGVFETVRRGKAYDNNQFEYGDIWQMQDFLHAIGGLNPFDFSTNEFQHRIKCPEAERLK